MPHLLIVIHPDKRYITLVSNFQIKHFICASVRIFLTKRNIFWRFKNPFRLRKIGYWHIFQRDLNVYNVILEYALSVCCWYHKEYVNWLKMNVFALFRQWFDFVRETLPRRWAQFNKLFGLLQIRVSVNAPMHVRIPNKSGFLNEPFNTTRAQKCFTEIFPKFIYVIFSVMIFFLFGLFHWEIGTLICSLQGK